MFDPATAYNTRAPARPVPKPRGFLFLRRFPGERIVLIDRRSLTWIEPLIIDPLHAHAKIAVCGFDEPLEMDLYDEALILQGDGVLRLHAIEAQGNRSYASLGLRVPRSVAIRREELVRGMPREELLHLAR